MRDEKMSGGRGFKPKHLLSLREESNLDKYELDKAIQKIRDEYGWWDRVKRQFR